MTRVDVNGSYELSDQPGGMASVVEVTAPERVSTGNIPAAARLSVGYRRYALCLLLGINSLNFLDRQVINILAEPIKIDLNLADWQLGLMSGFAFAIFYSVLGVPIARFAEHRNRPLIIATALIAWSAMTALCGSARTFLQLCLFRIGVGVGEAGCTPPAHSLITDQAPREKRASALAFYSMGVPLGSLLGMAMGGLVADQYGWRTAFLAAGAPGILLALVTAVTLRETRSRLKTDIAAAKAAQPSFSAAMKHLAGKRTFRLIALAAALMSFVGFGLSAFMASFFLRNHAAELAELSGRFGLQSVGFLGLVLGGFYGVFGAMGSFAGGWVTDKVSAKNLRNAMASPAIAVTLAVPLVVVAIMVDSAVFALMMLIPYYFLQNFWFGPVFATTQSVVPPQMRATAAAALLFIMNLIGLGLGPLLVGVASDFAAKGLGMGPAEGVRWALLGASLAGLVSGALFWRARKTYCEDLES